MLSFSVTNRTNALRRKMRSHILVCVFGAVMGLPAFAIEHVPMGKVTLTVGQATITSANGVTTTAQRGDSISVGDKIETTLNGHVHVRFVDGALVSVRPASELLVEDYRYDPAAADRSQVKFKLSRGTARAISGAAAEGARDHFRLNTPLVAIGIRGTDFVVHSNDNLTTAAVSYGAIIMTPFGEGCKAQGSGPCATSSARLLSADMSGMLAEYRTGLSQPELKQANAYNAPISDLARTATGSNGKTTAANSNSSSGVAVPAALNTSISVTPSAATATAAADGTLAAVNELPHIPYRANNLVDPDRRNADQVATAAVLATEAEKQNTSTTSNPTAVSPPIVVIPSTPATPAPATPATPATPVPPIALVPATLMWGRWSSDAIGPGDFSVVRVDAQAGRNPTIGNDKFVLYRNEGGFDFSRFASLQGETGFVLDKSFAQYTDGSGKTETASVLGGTLGINFSTRQFNTALSMTSASIGAQSLAVQGAVDNSGLFVTAQDGQRVAGAIALDGKSAGYLFDKAVSSGVLAGVTQWKAK